MKLQERLGNRQRRKVGNNTYLERRDNGVALRLHATDIVLETTDGWTVTSGGWRTPTTKDRLNAYLPTRIYQERGIWYWHGGRPFSDGDRIDFGGVVQAQATADSVKVQNKRRRAILAFARKCADAVPLPLPGPGDCWHCGMMTDDKTPLGDACKDHTHLQSHVDEGYVVPSLILHALKEAGCGDLILALAFGQADGALLDLARERVRRGVARYILRRLGMAS